MARPNPSISLNLLPNWLNMTNRSNPPKSIKPTIKSSAQTSSQTPGKRPSVRFVQIDEDQAGQRIDNFLLTLLKGVPKSKIYQIVRKGEVRVNKGRIKVHYKIQAGDEVRIPPVRVAQRDEIIVSKAVIRLMLDSIIYEDDDFLALNKPSGIAVHGGSGVKVGIIESLRKAKPDSKFLELVHRLDKNTSGCLLIAKKRSALRFLQDRFRQHKMNKKYLALVKGNVKNKSYHVELALLKSTLPSGERIVRVNKEGKHAVSDFNVIASSKLASLYEVDIKTGRTHQIRVHAKSLGHPVAGDEKYGDDEFNHQMKSYGLKRMFLHAEKLTLKTPQGKTLHLVAPIDNELQTILTNLDIKRS